MLHYFKKSGKLALPFSNDPFPNKSNTADPVDTGRKLNLHKTFTRLPGRLLNVVCTFNLRPVSTEESKFLT